jgi:predicted AlkP superfamily pyrophosphatase or phosphodiesterase
MSFSRPPARPAAPREPAFPAHRIAILFLIALLAFAWPALAQKSAAPQAAAQAPAKSTPKSSPSEAPRLVVVLVIDQFRADYLDRFRDSFESVGFARLLREGAVFRSCFYPYAITETGPGHATLATGTTPDRHGIASNNWYDAAKKRSIYALEDESAPVVGGAKGRTPVSPRNLFGTTLSDELRLATMGRARVFGVALKDRAAILSTGHGATGAYWFDTKIPGFVTSKYYRDALPDWVAAFNQAHPIPAPADRFPYSAASNKLTTDFAEALIEKEGLGKGEATDFLFIGFSANDYAGHQWGPYSKEVFGMTIETNRILAGLLKYLDGRLGKDRYWFALSADHGVAPTLAQARDPQLARLDAKNIDRKALRDAMQAALTTRWGAGAWLVDADEFFFDRATLREKNVSMEDATRVAGEAASAFPGIRGYVSPFGANASAQTADAYRLSYFPGRSPDLHIVPEPFALFDEEGGGTSHGTPYTYDTQVPLILYGGPFVPGDYYERASPLDLAPTLAAALKIHPPALATGRVLSEALRKAPRPASPPPGPSKPKGAAD